MRIKLYRSSPSSFYRCDFRFEVLNFEVMVSYSSDCQDIRIYGDLNEVYSETTVYEPDVICEHDSELLNLDEDYL